MVPDRSRTPRAPGYDSRPRGRWRRTSKRQLAWESRQRNAAGAAAAIAALFTFVGTVWRGLILSDLRATA